MNNLSTIQATATEQPSEKRPARWPASRTFVLAGLRPATTATRTQHVTLKVAFLIHAVAALLAVIVVSVIVASSELVGPMNAANVVEELRKLLTELAWMWNRRRTPATAEVVGVALLIEAGLLLLALWITPWGARDEPLRASYQHAVRRLWLQTAFVPMLVVLEGSVIIGLAQLNAQWERRHPGPTEPTNPPYPPYPRLTANDPAYAQAMAKHKVAVDRYWTQVQALRAPYDAWRRTKPWYLRRPEPVMVLCGFLLGAWLLWSLLRAVGAPRDVPALARPPTCESCGYNLSTIAMESRCPECGEPVVDSLGPDVRSGTAWQQGSDADRRGAYRRTLVGAVRRPRELGRSLRMSEPSVDHKRFLAIHLPVIFLIALVGLPVMMILVTGLNTAKLDASMSVTARVDAIVTAGIQEIPAPGNLPIAVAFLAGCVVTAGTVMLVQLIALVVGSYESYHHKRNLLPGSMQMACYLSGYLTAWAAFGATTIIAAVVLADSGALDRLSAFTRIHENALAFLGFLIPNLAWGIYYALLVARGTAATRYANR